jgi:penicillin V acylase-like amidase (Ntn superfamily)
LLLLGCTDVQINAKDSSVVVMPGNLAHQSTYLDGKPAMKWISKYAIAGIAPYQAPQTVTDGQNERGLRLEVLLLINLS